MSPCFSLEWHEIDMIGDQTTLFFHVLIFVISPFLLTVSKSLFKKQQCFNKFPCFTKFLPEKARNWQKGWTELCEVGKLSSVEIQKTKICFWQKINLKFPCVFLFSLCFFLPGIRKFNIWGGSQPPSVEWSSFFLLVQELELPELEPLLQLSHPLVVNRASQRQKVIYLYDD